MFIIFFIYVELIQLKAAGFNFYLPGKQFSLHYEQLFLKRRAFKTHNAITHNNSRTFYF